MAVVNLKSAAITNLDASLRVLNNAYIVAANLIEAVGLVEAANGDSATSVYRFFRIKSSDRLSALYLLHDAIATAGAIDIGLHTINGGAVVDADLFASAVTLQTARTVESDITYEATATNIDKAEKRIWELLGLTADPFLEYDVSATVTTAFQGAGTIVLKAAIAR